MHNSYTDIRRQMPDAPQWWDEYAVPRYCRFTPDETADIYANEAALIKIACQACGTEFHVCMSCSQASKIIWKNPLTLADQIRQKVIHYGDPPNTGCCAAGPTMNCEDIQVVEYWRKDFLDWVRDCTLEIALADESQ